MSASVLRRARAGYYGLMTHIDHQIHRFMQILVDHRLADNTWICFVSDHGADPVIRVVPLRSASKVHVPLSALVLATVPAPRSASAALPI